MFTIDAIVDVLDRHHQRATYGAVADLLGQPHRSLMRDCPKNRRYSWIVSQRDGLPSGYSDSQKHPALTEHPDILSTRDELVSWIKARRNRDV